MALLSTTMAFSSSLPLSSEWERPGFTHLYAPSRSRAPFPPLSSRLSCSPGETAVHSVCTHDLRYHQHSQRMILLPCKSPEIQPPTPCLNSDTWLFNFFSLTLMQATGPIRNDQTSPIMYVDRDHDSRHSENKGSDSLKGQARQLLYVSLIWRKTSEVNVMWTPSAKHES